MRADYHLQLKEVNDPMDLAVERRKTDLHRMIFFEC